VAVAVVDVQVLDFKHCVSHIQWRNARGKRKEER